MTPIAPRVPTVGQTAPDFPLPSSTNTTEMCAIQDDVDQFAERGVTVFGISVDSHHALREFKAMHRMQVELLSDFKREVSTQYGVRLPQRFLANRSYFLIDKAGVIRWAHVEETPAQRRENVEILAEIAKLS